MKILFTCIGRRVELVQAFRSAAEKLGINLVIYGTDMTGTAPAMYYCDGIFKAPAIRDEKYIPFLLELCKNEKIDAVIPTIDTDLHILSITKSEFEKAGTKVFISAPDKISICRDKRLTTEFFEKCGLCAPKTYDDINSYNNQFPCFIKPKDGSSSIFAYKVNNEEELKNYSQQVPDYIIQPFIEGTEYTVDVFCDEKSNPLYITPRIRLAVRAGEVLKTKISNDPGITEEVISIIKKFEPVGAITVQLIKEKSTGINYYIEINPRYGGGAPLSIKAGADSAEALLRILSGEKVSYFRNAAEDGAIFSRFDQSVRVYE